MQGVFNNKKGIIRKGLLEKGKNLTISYAAVQAAFWMDLCIALSFASVYLQGLGYSNTGLGIIIALGNLVSALIGPWIASVIDRSEKVTAGKVMPYIFMIRMALLAVLTANPKSGIITTICFTLYIAFSMSINSLNLKLYSDATYNGLTINYGVSRGMGSLAYVIISLVLGMLITNTSVTAVPIAGLCIGVFQIAAFAAFYGMSGAGTKSSAGFKDESAGSTQDAGMTIGRFILTYKRFSLILAGTVLVFYAHNVVCNFLINITSNVGSGTGGMGFLNGFMAFVEIPVMLAYSRFFGKKDTAQVLRFAFVMFTAKAIAIAAAPNMLLLTGAFVLQAPSFALYTAAIVLYIDDVIPHEDSAKAQSLGFTMTTFSSVFAGTIGGMLYDHTSVSATLWIAAAVSAIGSLVAVSGVRSRGK